MEKYNDLLYNDNINNWVRIKGRIKRRHMMSSNNNFLLKIHMEEDNNITEIYLNKERRSFTFINDECVSDLIIPEFKITSLNMILENISDTNTNDTYYAEYDKDDQLIREYDKDKINILNDMITKISINDFLDYYNNIKMNDYYIDNVIDSYNCVLPNEMKKIISYTTNGVAFSGEEKIYLMSHDSITNYNKEIANFIPLMNVNDNSCIGYDYKDSLYKEYKEKELIKETRTLEEMIKTETKKEKEVKEDIELLYTEEELENVKAEKNESIILENNKQIENAENTEDEYGNTIKNIDYQLEKLSNGIIVKEKEVSKTKEEIVENKSNLETEKESLEKRIEFEIEKLKYEKKQAEKLVKEDKIGKTAEDLLEKLSKEIDNLEELKTKVSTENIEITENLEEKGEKILHELSNEIKLANKERKNKKDQIERIEFEKEKLKHEKKQADKLVKDDKIGKTAEDLLEKLSKEIDNLEELKTKVSTENIEIHENLEEKGEKILHELSNEIKLVHNKNKDKVVENTPSSESEKKIIEKNDSSMKLINDERKKIVEKAKNIKENKIQNSREKEKFEKRLDFEIEKLEYERKKAEKLILSEGIGKTAELILEDLSTEIANLKKIKLENKISDITIIAKSEEKSKQILRDLENEIKKINKQKKNNKEKSEQVKTEIEKLKYEKKQAEKLIIKDELGKKAKEILEELNQEIRSLEELNTSILNENVEIPKNLGESGNEILCRLASEIELVNKERKLKQEKIERVNFEIKKLNNEKKQAQKLIVKDELGQSAEDILNKLSKEIDDLEEIKTRIFNENIEIPENLGEKAEEILHELANEIKLVNKEKRFKEEKIERVNFEIKKLKHEKKEAEKLVLEDEIGKTAEEILEELNQEIGKLEEIKTKIKTDNIDVPKDLGQSGIKTLHKLTDEIKIVNRERRENEEKIERINFEIKKLKFENKQATKLVLSEKIGNTAEDLLKQLGDEISKLESLKEQILIEKIELPKKISKSGFDILKKLSDEIEKVREERDEEKAKKKAEKEQKLKEEQKEFLVLNEMINKSIFNGLDNYKINLNDTHKLIIEHLPYYEITNSFDVIQIPEIEVDKLTLIPQAEIDFGKIKLTVHSLNNNKVDLLVCAANSIVDKDNNRIKKGTHLLLDLKNEIILRLNKKGVMETWSLKMEKSTFEKELRNIDYGKMMNIISELDSYKKLGNLEKYEMQKSVMLFIYFIMNNKDFNKLKEIYRILEKEPSLYEEFITKYNIICSLEGKNKLATYEQKKGFVTKLNYIKGLIDAKWLDYPRYIFNAHNYFANDDFLEDFIEELNATLTEKDFYNYLKKLFKEYEMFENLDEEGCNNLDKCLEYLSVLYKYYPNIGEDNKYKIEKTFMIGAEEEDIALLISKLCRRGITDYAAFVEYDVMMKEKYRLGQLTYPIYSENFNIEEIRNGGEDDEY